VRQLPDDLADMGDAEISVQRAVRDDYLAALFQRWPALTRFELGKLQQIYVERLRIAKYLGNLRARRASAEPLPRRGRQESR
jgi:hypothetical protein